MNDLRAIRMMSLSEYWLRLEASQIKKVERQEELALQSWFNQTVQATTGHKKPKPKFKKFEQFFDSISNQNKIHKKFNKNYVPVIESKSEIESDEKEKIMERMKQFRKLQEESS